MSTSPRRHRPPSSCPVCGDRLLLTRLGCDACGSELAGAFEPCRFCALDRADHELLEVFLRSRGNVKELARHLDVSYPTARSRYDALLSRLGIEPADGEELATLRALASGEIDVDEAQRRL